MSSAARWAARSIRASTLAERHPPAADILRFYARLAAYQQTLSARLTPVWDPPAVLELLPTTLDWLEQNGPPGMTSAVSSLRDSQTEDWPLALARYLAEDTASAEDIVRTFVIEMLLQPLAESCAAAAPARQTGHDNRCPFCRQVPATAVLRDAGHGTRRALVCGLCFTEWGFARIGCPSCGEHKFDALPVFTAEQVAGARIDGCDSCGTYLKTLDASKDGTVLPEVDDLATIALDLWARERGYRRIRVSSYV